MTFQEALATQPDWIRLWVLWLLLSANAMWIVLLIMPGARRDGLLILAVNVVMGFAMSALYEEIGYVRLLGLPHLIFWGPLLVYLALRLKRGAYDRIAGGVVAVGIVTLSVSLAIDLVDVIRYLLGERASMIPV